MNLYHVSQKVHRGYDTYSDAVIAATSEDEARTFHPRKVAVWNGVEWVDKEDAGFDWNREWAKPSEVEVKLIGTACHDVTRGVVACSYHAG